ncbi:MAG: hypothetical protein MSH33_00930 [Fusobacterium necrophorum]|nr:hypothetical protein [Fusobacterium necrophorum]MDY2572692.1 hypothetical protein [Fusobacterium necrophorum]
MRIVNLIYNRDGHGYMSTKISIPKKWADDIGFSEEDREAEISYDEKKKEIVIKKRRVENER